MLYIASQYKIVSGHGIGDTELNAFDNALQVAGVGNYNLIKVSSILPPACKESKNIDIPHGALLPIAYSAIHSSQIGEVLVAAIGVGIPSDLKDVGVIMEFSSRNPSIDVEENVRKMVRDAMKNRNIRVENILYRDCRVVVERKHECAFAAVALL